MKQIAVIILNWNGAEMLRRFLPSVLQFTPANLAEVIVADNGSTDSSRELLKEEFPQVRTIYFSENLGFAQGYNEAVRIVNAPYTVLLNSDVEVKDDWLTPLYRFMERHAEAGAVQPKVLSVNNPERFEYAGAAGGYLDCHGYPYCRGRIFDVTEEDCGQYDTDVAVHWATGAALMVRTSCYLEVGGLDSLFFAHMEEIDLCWRMRLAGWKIYAVSDSRVWHLGGGSLPAASPKKTYLNFRNSLLMLHKNLPAGVRGRLLFTRRLLDSLAWMKFVAEGKWAHAAAIVRAHRDFRRMVRRHYKNIPQSAESNLLQEAPAINILSEYYWKGHKTFKEVFHRKSTL